VAVFGSFTFHRKKGRQNMGMFKKIKFWRKKKPNTTAKVDACHKTGVIRGKVCLVL
jgi:hypothetical protein